MTIQLAFDGSIFSRQTAGGITALSKNILKFLPREGLHIDLYTLSNHINPGRLELDHIGEYPTITKFQASTFRIKLNDLQYDVFHTPYYALTTDQTRTVVTVHDFIDDYYNMQIKSLPRRLIKWRAIKNADVLVCVSKATRNDLLKFYTPRPTQDIVVILNGVSDIFGSISPLSIHSQPRGLPDNYILYVGSRAHYKNFNSVLFSLDFLKDVYLVCVGGGPFRPSETAHVSPGILSRLVHYILPSDHELNEIYNYASCLVYPSSYEGFGIPVLEAMRTRTPVIISQAPALKEVASSYAITLSKVSAFNIACAYHEACALSTKSLESAYTYSLAFTYKQASHNYYSVYQSLAKR